MILRCIYYTGTYIHKIPISILRLCISARIGLFSIKTVKDAIWRKKPVDKTEMETKWRSRRAIERPVNDSASVSAASGAGYLPWWNHSFVFLHDRLAQEDVRRRKRQSDLPLGVRGERQAEKRGVKRRKEKGEPVIGIGAVEKPWKINYRPCKGVENYIDRRCRRPRRWLAPSPPSLRNAVIGCEQRLIL